jgi:hypothetical protein
MSDRTAYQRRSHGLNLIVKKKQMSFLRRLEIRRESKQKEWDTIQSKLTCLRQARNIETDPSTKFKLEEQIREIEQNLSVVERELIDIEQQIEQVKPPEKILPSSFGHEVALSEPKIVDSKQIEDCDISKEIADIHISRSEHISGFNSTNNLTINESRIKPVIPKIKKEIVDIRKAVECGFQSLLNSNLKKNLEIEFPYPELFEVVKGKPLFIENVLEKLKGILEKTENSNQAVLIGKAYDLTSIISELFDRCIREISELKQSWSIRSNYQNKLNHIKQIFNQIQYRLEELIVHLEKAAFQVIS